MSLQYIENTDKINVLKQKKQNPHKPKTITNPNIWIVVIVHRKKSHVWFIKKILLSFNLKGYPHQNYMMTCDALNRYSSDMFWKTPQRQLIVIFSFPQAFCCVLVSFCVHIQEYAEAGAYYYHFLLLSKNILWSLIFFFPERFHCS